MARVMYSIDRFLLNESKSSITILHGEDGSYRLYVAKCPKSKTGFQEPIVVYDRQEFAKKLVELMFDEKTETIEK